MTTCGAGRCSRGLNPLTAQSQVAGAEAALDELRAAAAAAQAEYARAQGARDSFSVEEFERRRTGALTAQAKVKLAEAQLDEAHTRWQRTAGGCAQRRHRADARSRSRPDCHCPAHGRRCFAWRSGGAIEMRGQVAEQDMPRLKVGTDRVQVRLDGVAQPFTGKVWQIGAIIDAVTRQGSVRIALSAA